MQITHKGMDRSIVKSCNVPGNQDWFLTKLPGLVSAFRFCLSYSPWKKSYLPRKCQFFRGTRYYWCCTSSILVQTQETQEDSVRAGERKSIFFLLTQNTSWLCSWPWYPWPIACLGCSLSVLGLGWPVTSLQIWFEGAKGMLLTHAFSIQLI